MKLTSIERACTTPNDMLCKTSPSDASRYVAWVSAAGAIALGVTVGGFLYRGLKLDGTLLVMLVATVLHFGQAVASAISLKLGAFFATIAFVIATSVLVIDYQSFVLLTVPLFCSACAIIIARRHAQLNANSVG